MDTEPLVELLCGLPDAVALVDEHAIVRWANAAMERVVGHPVDELVGTTATELVHPDDREWAFRALGGVEAEPVGAPIELRVRARDGWRLAEVVGAPLDDGRLAICLRDITERRHYDLARGDDAQLRSLVHNAGVVVVLLGRDGTVRSVSSTVLGLTGHDPDTVARVGLTHLLATDEDRAHLRQALTTAEPGEPSTVVVTMQTRDPDLVLPVEVRVADLSEDPTVEGFVLTLQDATERVAAEAELRRALSLLRATLDSTADGVLVMDEQDRVTSVNRRYLDMWQIPEGLRAHGARGEATEFVLSELIDPDAYLSVVREMKDAPHEHSSDIVEFKDGRVFERVSIPQFVDGRIVGRVWSFRDRTEQKRLESELVYRAFHDQLTGLANKERFSERVQHTASRARRTAARFAVLFLDLDNFKTVNDSLGHHAGDELLLTASRILTSCLRDSDTAARLGGDEFAVLMEDLADERDALFVAERIRDCFRDSFHIGEHQVFSTVSIGIAFGGSDSTTEQILRDADLAMYAAKARGKDRFETFETRQHDAAVVRIEVEAELRRAVSRDEFILFYQPIVAASSADIAAVEALVRWDHPTRGLLAPATFIPLAEDLGLMDLLGRRLLERACVDVQAVNQGPQPRHQRRGEHLGQSARGRLARRRRRRRDRRFGHRTHPPDHRDHRDRHDGRHRAGVGHAGRTQGPRRADRARRLRHRLFVPRLPPTAPHRHRQDRQELRPVPRRPRRATVARSRDHQAGSLDGPRHRRRGRREPRPAR